MKENLEILQKVVRVYFFPDLWSLLYKQDAAFFDDSTKTWLRGPRQ